MRRIGSIFINLIFCVQVLLTFLLFFESKVALPVWLQVAGRLHPLVLHLPIGLLFFMVVLLLVQRQLDKEAFRKIVFTVLLVTSLTASFTALFGFFLSLSNEAHTEALIRHKISGVALSWICYLLLLSYRYYFERQIIFSSLTAFTMIVLVITGHTGASITHGENFLLDPLKKNIVLTAENASLYEFAVKPVLEKKCFTCHNEAKAKGGLIMTSVEKFMKGGENGKPWVDGKPEESNLIRAIHLPLEHEEHMPPEGKAQLTEYEIQLLETWIKSGPDFGRKLHEFPEDDTLRVLVSSRVIPAVVPQKEYDFKPASEKTIEKLVTPSCTVLPLYTGSPALQVHFFLRESFTPQHLQELKSINDQLVILNAAKMPVTDKDLSVIGTFKNLEQLNLNFTPVTGSELSQLSSLKNLRSLSLSGLPVTAAQLEPLLSLPLLEKVFLWNTRITDDELKALSGRYAQVSFITTSFQDEGITKLNTPVVDNEDVIKQEEEVVLKHGMPGVTIYYSLDGTDPDTTQGTVYTGPFPLDKTAQLKARACKDGWYCSKVYEKTCFVQKYLPEEVSLLQPPDPQYPGEGAASLTDGRKGFPDLFKEASWLGYRDLPFMAGFDFGTSAPVIGHVVISYGKSIGAYIFPPDEVVVWAGEQEENMKLIARMKIPQPSGYDRSAVEAIIIPVDSARYRFYRVMAKPVAKLPEWHNAKGDKGWVFVDEVFFN